MTGIASAFTSFFQHKYHRIDLDNECVAALANLICAELPQDMVHTYESPFASEEIYKAINSGGMNRAPGRDGLSLEFYKTAWPLIGDDLCRIINSVFFDRTITPQRKLGTIVCFPKLGLLLMLADCSPMTLLNCDYKILTYSSLAPAAPIGITPESDTILWSPGQYHIRCRGHGEGHHCLR
jgi:hypothetical protein